MIPLLRIVITAAFLAVCAGSNARQLRGLQTATSNGTASDAATALFRITVVGTFMEDESGTITKDEEGQVSCIPIVDGKETHGLYAITLPQIILDQYSSAIQTGDLFVSITHTSRNRQEMVLSENSTVTVIADPRMEFRTENAVALTKGTKTMAIVRISTVDATPKDDAATLHDGLFSLDKVNLRTQYRACSFDELDWVPASSGVLEVLVDQPVSNFKTGAELVSAALDTMTVTHGIANAAELADKVVMCLPPGTGGWVASSGVNHWRAQFNNDWCLSLTATMHEV
jgi:hypothetical protein